jgi:alkylation response protein AidB-like acyl-CoA dehydrogenase
MQFELSAEQRAIVDAVEKLLERHAGPKRARELSARNASDEDLERALSEAGFDRLAASEGTGPLEAALVTEAIARRAGLVAFAAQALVAPALSNERFQGPVALAVAGERGPVRFGVNARTLLISDGDTVRVRHLTPADIEPVRSNFGFPAARLRQDGGDRLAPGTGERMRAWWRVALAAEMAGTMKAALDVTLDHVRERIQFGRPIGSFQAVQHRLAECAVLIEGARWLAYEAAWHGAPAEAASLAAAHSATASLRVFHDCHQFNGAMGLTREHDLHVWSMRLPALQLEMEGPGHHRQAAALARWGPG